MLDNNILYKYDTNLKQLICIKITLNRHNNTRIY